MVSRKNNKYIESKRGRLITLLIASFVLLLSVGYTALNEELTISGEASFRVEEDIRVTGINLIQTTNSSIEDYNPTYGKDSIKVGVTLPSNQSTVTYKVKIANYSNVAMKIAKIEKLVTNNNYTITFNKTLPLTIGKLSEEEIEITFKNNTSASQIVESTLQFTFEKLESMMTVGNSNASTSTFYNGPITKDSIESITFMSTKEIPEDAVGYWDCSYVQGKNEVVAYYLNSETEGMYDLYIAADGEVYAPSNSRHLFKYFTKAININFNNSFNTSKVTTMGYYEHGMFQGCKLLKELDLSNFNTENVTSMSQMFSGCSSLTSVDLSSFNTSKVTTMGGLYGNGMFSGCSSLRSLDLSNFNTEKVTTMTQMFTGCSSLTSVDLSNFNTEKVTDMISMFHNCSSLIELDLSSFNTKNVSKMNSSEKGMFSRCSSLKNLDLSNFNTSNITTMTEMFYGCSSLVNLDLSNFNTEKVTNMRGMFSGCSSLTNLDLSSFNTEKVTDMSGLYGAGMFSGCSSLVSLNLSNFNTSNVTTMASMFSNCKKLENLNLSNFTTNSLSSIYKMFQNCSSLTELDIRNMDFENITVDTGNIFTSVPSGVNIYVLNEYNQNFIQNLKSNANVIIPEA